MNLLLKTMKQNKLTKNENHEIDQKSFWPILISIGGVLKKFANMKKWWKNVLTYEKHENHEID